MASKGTGRGPLLVHVSGRETVHDPDVGVPVGPLSPVNELGPAAVAVVQEVVAGPAVEVIPTATREHPVIAGPGVHDGVRPDAAQVNHVVPAAGVDEHGPAPAGASKGSPLPRCHSQ